jgi:chromosome segregation ATPase
VYEQTIQRDEIGMLNGIVFQKNTDIQNDTNSIAVLNHQIEQMDARITEIKATAAVDEQRVVSQKNEILQLQFANENFTNEIAQYKTAVDTLESKLKNAYAGIEKQNETITNLLAQRDDFVQKLNDSLKERNDIVNKYNELVKQVEKQSGSGSPPDK